MIIHRVYLMIPREILKLQCFLIKANYTAKVKFHGRASNSTRLLTPFRVCLTIPRAHLMIHRVCLMIPGDILKLQFFLIKAHYNAKVKFHIITQ